MVKYLCTECRPKDKDGIFKNLWDGHYECRAIISDKCVGPHGCLYPADVDVKPKWKEEN